MLPCAAQELIKQLGLVEHPEGGYYQRIYTASAASTAPNRAAATAIHYLLVRGRVSRLHSLLSDELWFHHAGDALTVVEVARSGPTLGGSVVQTRLGGGGGGGRLFHAVHAGTAFGAELPEGSEWALVSCVVVPGFDFADWRLVSRAEAVAGIEDAAARAVLERLTHPATT